MPDRPRVHEITSPNEKLLRGVYTLLRRTFPPHELVPLSEMQNSLRERAAGVLADLSWHMFAAARKGRVIGVASGTYFGSLNVGIVGYLTVSAAARTRGLGPKLRQRLRAAFERDAQRIRKAPLRAIVGEVEEDNAWLSHLTRRGALVLDFPYRQPGLRPNARVVPLALYYQPLDRPRRYVSESLVKQVVFALWRRGYRIAKPLNDARFRAMLQSLKGRSRIGGRTLPAARGRATVRE